MNPLSSNGSLGLSLRLTGFERLEPRRVLDCHGFGTVGVCVPGDSDGNGEFDQRDLVQVLQESKYLTGETASWREGDWNGDSVFDQLDVSAALSAGTYRQGVILVDLSSLVAGVPAHSGPFGPPIIIANKEQLNAVIADPAIRDAVADATDFSRQTLLLFSWSGSGGDRLIGEATVVAGRTNVALRFQFGLTNDLRQHQALLALPKDADWRIDVEDSVIHEDTASYQFVVDESRLMVTGGFAGVSDKYSIEGSLELTRNADGTAFFSNVEATLRGDGLSSLGGQQLDSVLNLSELSGLQMGNSTVVLSGHDNSGYGVVRLQLMVEDGSLTVRGGNMPPCCDFFQYDVEAAAISSDV